MNTMTARALMLGLVIALWAWLADVARLHVSLWAGVVALGCFFAAGGGVAGLQKAIVAARSEEHTSELQSPCNLGCRLLLEKKKKNTSADLYAWQRSTTLRFSVLLNV